MPAKEWPASTVGPSWRANTRFVSAAASSSVVSGFWTETTLSPAACNRGITSDHEDPSANSPCTSTTLRARMAGWAQAGRASMAALPPSVRAARKARRSIMAICSYDG